MKQAIILGTVLMTIAASGMAKADVTYSADQCEQVGAAGVLQLSGSGIRNGSATEWLRVSCPVSASGHSQWTVTMVDNNTSSWSQYVTCRFNQLRSGRASYNALSTLEEGSGTVTEQRPLVRGTLTGYTNWMECDIPAATAGQSGLDSYGVKN